ncbi:hypothetical protein LXA43DRAFT_1101010 [Ganoderma leucocontextum]|nr:hypothetical protein LXA43DRAFT_1101010 [Ganoderma leucocontextum]
MFTFTAKLPITAGPSKLLDSAALPSTVVKAFEAPTISLRSAFNAVAPANHLPAELVVKILATGAWGRWKELVALTHICQHWRNVALGTPQLWADAARSVLTGKCAWINDRAHWPKCLPTFLERSLPCPLAVELRSASYLVSQLKQDAVLKPHFSRLAHLSVQVTNVNDVIAVLQIVRSHVPNLESLHMPQADRPFLLEGSNKKILSCQWDDADLLHLHTLTIPAPCFTRSIAVASLKTLILYGGPRSHVLLIAGLDRCGSALESLTLRSWSHPQRASNARNSAAPTVELPSLRRLKVGLNNECVGDPLSLLFASLSFPSGVAIDIHWHYLPGNTRQLLPKHLTGLHAPPFFDSMCLHLFGLPETASVHCYVGDAERLCIRELPLCDSIDRRGRDFSEFLEEHRYPTVTQLAVDFDVDPRQGYRYTALARADILREYIRSLPNLCRLELLGKSIRDGDVKLEMVNVFLGLASGSSDAPVARAEKTLAYVCEASEDLQVSNQIAILDRLRAQLDQLEVLLRIRLAEGGPRLHRLELCIAYSSRIPHPPPRVYPYIRNVPPSTVLTAYLSSLYLPRFQELVSEVVFIGDAKRRGSSYRVFTGGARQPLPGPMSLSRGKKTSNAR